jgi:hypothetical protein
MKPSNPGTKQQRHCSSVMHFSVRFRAAELPIVAGTFKKLSCACITLDWLYIRAGHIIGRRQQLKWPDSEQNLHRALHHHIHIYISSQYRTRRRVHEWVLGADRWTRNGPPVVARYNHYTKNKNTSCLQRNLLLGSSQNSPYSQEFACNCVSHVPPLIGIVSGHVWGQMLGLQKYLCSASSLPVQYHIVS